MPTPMTLRVMQKTVREFVSDGQGSINKFDTGPTTKYEQALLDGNLGKKQRAKFELKLQRKREREVRCVIKNICVVFCDHVYAANAG